MAEILIGNVKGPIGAIGPVGPQGIQGPAGPQGPAGASPDIASTSVAGIVKAGEITVTGDGTMGIGTGFTQSQTFANIVKNEKLVNMLGKFAAWFPRIESALQKSDLVSVQTDDQNKAASAALAYAMQQQLDQVNSDIGKYSESEILCGEWLGLPLYCKVIHTGVFTTKKTIAHNTANIDTIFIDCAHSFAILSGGLITPLPFSHPSTAEWGIGVQVDNQNISITAGSRVSATDSHITILYTLIK